MNYQKAGTVQSGVGSAGGKFANRNLNTSGVASKPGTSKEKTFGSTIKGNYVMQGVKSKFGKAVGAAAAPTPLNTPSIRRENNGKDITIALVPIGNPTVWGANGEKQSMSQGSSDAPFVPTSPVIAKPAPWTKTTQDVIEERDYKIKKPTTPSKSWADAESDEDDEDNRSAPSTPARGSVSLDIAVTQKETRFEHSNGVQLRPAYQLRPNQGVQRDRSDSGGHQIPFQQQHQQQHQQQQHQQPYRGNSFDQPVYNSVQHNAHQSKMSPADEQERQQQRAIEASRLELEQLESRKIRQQEQQQQHSNSNYNSQDNQLLRPSPAHLAGQNQYSTGNISGGDYLRGTSFNTQHHHLQTNPHQQQQFSGSGLLNSSGSSRVSSSEEPLTWERAKRRPIEAPPSAPSRPALPVAPSTHFIYSHNGVHQQQHPLGVPPSTQYSQLQLLNRNRSRGPSEDLSAPTVRQQEQTEIRLKEATIQAAAVDPNKSFASLFPKPATTAVVVNVSAAEEAEISASDAAYHQQDTHSSKYNVVGENQHHSRARHPVAASAAAPQRKMLFEPKSGQFVDSAAASLESSSLKHVGKHTPSAAAPAPSSVPSGDSATKWARAPRKPDVVAADNVTASDSAAGGASSKVPTAVLTRATGVTSSATTARSVETPASKLAMAEEYHLEREAAKVAERNLERDSRGARTLGLLFRFVGEARTGEVHDDRDIEQVVTPAEKADADRKRSEATGPAPASTAAVTNETEDLGRPLYKRSSIATKASAVKLKEHKLPIKKIRASKTLATKKGQIQLVEEKLDTLKAAVDNFDSELSKLQLSNELGSAVESTIRWTQGNGVHLLQPQQDPNVELDSSLSGHFGGILSASSAASSSSTHDSTHWNYNSFESNGGIGSNYYILDGFSPFDGVGGAAPPPLLGTDSRSGDVILSEDRGILIAAAPIERVKRGIREKFSVKNDVIGERRYSVPSRPKTTKVFGIRAPRLDKVEKERLTTDQDSSQGTATATAERIKDKRGAPGRGGRGGEGRGSKFGTPRKGGPSAHPLAAAVDVPTAV